MVVKKYRFCVQLLQYCYIKLLWIHRQNAVSLVQVRNEITVFLQLLQLCYSTVLSIPRLTAVLLIQCRGKRSVMPAVSAVLLNHSSLDT